LADISRSLRFCWEESGAFSGNTTYFSPAIPPWLLGVMNSTIFEFLLCFSTNTIRGGFMRLFTNSLDPLPVPSVSNIVEARLRDLVLAFREGEVMEDRTDLDQLACQAYGLAPADLDVIYKWFESRSLPVATGEGGEIGEEDQEAD
jgi:hypothetical protein